MQHIDGMFEIRWLNYLLKTFREEKEMAEKQIEVLPEEMLEEQFEVLPKEEETQRLHNFDVCFMIVGTKGRTKGGLVQEKKEDDDRDW